MLKTNIQLFFVPDIPAIPYVHAVPHVPDIPIISLWVAEILKLSELSELSFLSELVIKWPFLAVLLILRLSKTRTLYITCVDITGAAC